MSSRTLRAVAQDDIVVYGSTFALFSDSETLTRCDQIDLQGSRILGQIEPQLVA